MVAILQGLGKYMITKYSDPRGMGLSSKGVEVLRVLGLGHTRYSLTKVLIKDMGISK